MVHNCITVQCVECDVLMSIMDSVYNFTPYMDLGQTICIRKRFSIVYCKQHIVRCIYMEVVLSSIILPFN